MSRADEYTVMNYKLLQIMPAPAGMRAVYWDGVIREFPVYIIGLFEVTPEVRSRATGRVLRTLTPHQQIEEVSIEDCSAASECSNHAGYLMPGEGLEGSEAEATAKALALTVKPCAVGDGA